MSQNSPVDTNTNAENGAGIQPFTAREMQMLGWAMQSMKTPPDIDYEKLAGFAGMSNHRSAYNAWTKIKGKLFANMDEAQSTPKRGRKKPVDGEGGETPKKATPRKRAAKKNVDADADADADGSPVKKPRATKVKTEVKDDNADNGDVAAEVNDEEKPEV
ncbi:unnamed protein product [Periconia digitata]|uniref:Uncharacterized protein n=1 Tax=Periconia digitata TaxID=1303443 RepID=A0A9W4U5W1_9PLEO|nr:unnamed protein product [Periconia digitata]